MDAAASATAAWGCVNYVSARQRPSVNMLFVGLLLLGCVLPALGLRCIRCGEYTDGVGSITPCLNYTESQHLKDCDSGAQFCVKYVTEASIVRDCVADCEEREAWGTKIYCCSEDGCNTGGWSRSNGLLLLSSMLMLALRRLIW